MATKTEYGLAGCEEGGDHVPEYNEHRDAWCSNCGERLLLPGTAGYQTWTERVAQLKVDEARLESDRQAFIDEMAAFAKPLLEGHTGIEAARFFGIEVGHAPLLVHRLVRQRRASTGFMEELAPALDREAVAS